MKNGITVEEFLYLANAVATVKTADVPDAQAGIDVCQEVLDQEGMAALIDHVKSSTVSTFLHGFVTLMGGVPQ